MRRAGAVLALFIAACARAATLDDALAAEARLDSRAALELFLAVEKERPSDAFVFQKIAKQYSDLVVDQPNDAEKRRYATAALAYAEKAVALDSRSAVSVLSVAVARGKLAVYSGTREKVRLSRVIKADAELALALDPNYAWAHHVLGRWHYEVVELGASARLFVQLFYGGLPAARVTEAVAHLERATELESDELNHWLELGFAYEANGEPEKARSVWIHGLAMPSRGKHDEPAKQRAREALAKLD
jgi:tetratricopeptide (TPR) repeat protein